MSSTTTTKAAPTTPTTPTTPKLRKRFASLRKSMNESQQRILEEHFRVDASEKVILPGVPKHDADTARDMHDFFNLIILVPVVVLNFMNWNWDLLLNLPADKDISDAWTGEWFETFFFVTAGYFVVDLMWIMVWPKCVKSPAVITVHHLSTLLYIMVPYNVAAAQWCMGACMSVEFNTWFLIARRVFNKQGFSPWVIDLPAMFSLKVKFISVMFYTSWILVRCVLYPILWFQFRNIWLAHSEQIGTKWNLLAIAVPLHTALCILNLKWSYDLLMSKIRYWRLSKSNSLLKEKDMISKGL